MRVGDRGSRIEAERGDQAAGAPLDYWRFAVKRVRKAGRPSCDARHTKAGTWNEVLGGIMVVDQDRTGQQ
jgi:hypothetical protein